MKFYFDRSQNIAFLTSRCNGSTVLENLSLSDDRLKPTWGEDMFRILDADPSIPVYCAFRNPLVRFASGLTSNLTNTVIRTYASDIKWTQIGVTQGKRPDPSQMKVFFQKFEENLVFLSTLSQHSNEGMPGFPYHLFDAHCDHSLWAPLILLATNYNIVLTPLSDYSNLLESYYPQTYKKSIVGNHRIRPDSFDKTNQWSKTYVDVYEKVVKSEEFNVWMAPEKLIFDTFYQNSLVLIDDIRDLIKHLLFKTDYFNEVAAPRSKMLCELTAYINSSMLFVPELKQKIDCYREFAKSTV
jgi:hypothetical protein